MKENPCRKGALRPPPIPTSEKGKNILRGAVFALGFRGSVSEKVKQSGNSSSTQQGVTVGNSIQSNNPFDSLKEAEVDVADIPTQHNKGERASGEYQTVRDSCGLCQTVTEGFKKPIEDASDIQLTRGEVLSAAAGEPLLIHGGLSYFIQD
ncbi:hypothetical protein QJS10_CPA01g02393 [Acorus calamus]|uniref:Uncharacterized protein n=1 Tax=Acorus calamus TaxID=4465 RepID=A0AAV9FFA6_ACOCL|nr:hypothetical protein QJS10_CPA01g02393 [Acorus calamus]